jgi:hypothetical protein
LYISTSEWVLHTLFTHWNHVFLSFPVFSQKERNDAKMPEKERKTWFWPVNGMQSIRSLVKIYSTLSQSIILVCQPGVVFMKVFKNVLIPFSKGVDKSTSPWPPLPTLPTLPTTDVTFSFLFLSPAKRGGEHLIRKSWASAKLTPS